MKKLILYSLIMSLVFTFCACVAVPSGNFQEDPTEVPDNEEHKDPEADTQQEMDVCAVDSVAFSSLEEFETALAEIQTASPSSLDAPSDDIGNMAGLDVYYVPNGIPDGYVLGKVLVGSVGVAFYYYPEDKADSRDGQMTAEGKQECFEFRFYRWELDDPLSGIMRQLEQTEDDYIEERFLLDSSRNTYYWAQNGDALAFRFPKDWELPTSGLSTFCSAETVFVSP